MDPNVNVSEQRTHPGVVNVPNRKRVRGPTQMREIWGQRGERIKVEFNDFGQPIDEEESSKLAHFIVTIARTGKYAPLDKDWHAMSNVHKNDMLRMVAEKFELPPGVETWVLQSFVKKVRNHRANIMKNHYNPNLSFEEQLRQKPNGVLEDQWKNLLLRWQSEKAKAISAKNKENRRQKRMNHTTGKKSFAMEKETGHEPGIAELFIECYSKNKSDAPMRETDEAIVQMREELDELPSGSHDKKAQDDIFERAMGKEKGGRIRMYGLGVTEADIRGTIPSRSTSYRMSAKWQHKVEQLEERLQRMEQQSNRSSQCNFHEESFSDVHVTSPQPMFRDSSVERGEGRPIRVGDYVTLKSITNLTHDVAKGYVHSLNPTTIVGGQVLRPSWCEVSIQVVLDSAEHLIRSYGLFATIGDAIGATVAWPCTLVVRDHEV